MNETDHKALVLVVTTLYPYQPRYLSIPFRWAKRELMRAVGLNRWDFDKWLIDLQVKTSDEGIYAFCLLDCDSLPASRLNYVLWWGGGHGYCSLQFDMRNKYMKAVLAELERN